MTDAPSHALRPALRLLRRPWAALALFAALACFSAWRGFALAQTPPQLIPPPTLDQKDAVGPQTVVLAGGCFWGMQGVFQHVRGVTGAVSGYSGGSAADAHYETVSTGTTGHAESVQITFDPKKITFGKLLQIYFSVAHDPTELDRQGPDEGTQYRSAIFPENPEQAKIAKAYIAELDKDHVFERPIVTRIEAFKGFYPAERYHQDFLTLHPDYPYIVINDLPKIANLKKFFPAYYREKPALVFAADAARANASN